MTVYIGRGGMAVEIVRGCTVASQSCPDSDSDPDLSPWPLILVLVLVPNPNSNQVHHFKSELPSTMEFVAFNTNVPHNLAESDYSHRVAELRVDLTTPNHDCDHDHGHGHDQDKDLATTAATTLTLATTPAPQVGIQFLSKLLGRTVGNPLTVRALKLPTLTPTLTPAPT